MSLDEEITQAEGLAKPPSNDEEKEGYNDRLHKAISLFNKWCMDRKIGAQKRLEVLARYLQANRDEAIDMLARWRDSLPHLRGPELSETLDLLNRATRCSTLDSFQRYTTAVSLYNNGQFHVCYECLADLAADKTIMVEHRVDATRYLYATEDEDHKETAQETLVEIVDSQQYPSDYRYKVIASFIGKTGISSMMNANKLRIPYDELFVHGLQRLFFLDSNNGVRERILSGQHILQMKRVKDEEKRVVGSKLLEIAGDPSYDEDTRADAADVILRLAASPTQRGQGRKIITELGFDAADNRSSDMMERARTIYSNTQNVHQFTDQVEAIVKRFINKIIREKPKVPSFPEVHTEVVSLVKKTLTPPGKIPSNENRQKMYRAIRALNRIAIDTARFTSHQATLGEVFAHVWVQITSQEDASRQDELEKRMVEELVDMGETCSSGHIARFVNILSAYDETLKVSWPEQIKANMVGRMNARIRDCPDEILKERLLSAPSELGSDEDRKAYTQFIAEQGAELRTELQGEFVGEGYVSLDVFNQAFEEGQRAWEI